MEHFDRLVYRYLVAAALVLIAGGTVFYHFFEKFTWVNSFYFCVVTLATVGYGDIVPKTDLGKIFTSFYILLGVGIITTFFAATVRRRGAKMHERSDKNDSAAPKE